VTAGKMNILLFY